VVWLDRLKNKINYADFCKSFSNPALIKMEMPLSLTAVWKAHITLRNLWEHRVANCKRGIRDAVTLSWLLMFLSPSSSVLHHILLIALFLSIMQDAVSLNSTSVPELPWIVAS
jgi:hypothetical protein